MAAVSVSLVALPLALGIALASDLPPVTGILSALVGGLVTTFLRSSHVAVNGPANGLIVVLLASVEALRDEAGVAYPYILAAAVMAGAFQVVMGLLKLGRLGDFFPSAVIQGMLAAFGVVIVGKQVYTAIGHRASGKPLEMFTSFPEYALKANIPVLIIAGGSLAILILHSRSKNRTIHFLPAPLWVLLFAIPAAALFGFHNEINASLAGKTWPVGSEFLIQLPDSLVNALVTPDFSRIREPVFWTVVFSLCFVTSVETILSAKAVDMSDPYRRQTDLSRDLTAVGLSSMLSGFIGGLPVTAVIVRSSVSINHGAQTRWSNFFHGLLLPAVLLLIPALIRILSFGASPEPTSRN